MLVSGLGYYFAIYVVPSEDDAMDIPGEILLHQDQIAAGVTTLRQPRRPLG